MSKEEFDAIFRAALKAEHPLTKPPTVLGHPPTGQFQSVPLPPVPEFGPLPPARGRDPITGASRTWLIEGEAAGHFKLVRIRKPGAMRGKVFIHYPSLLEFLRRNLTGQKPAPETVEGQPCRAAAEPESPTTPRR